VNPKTKRTGGAGARKRQEVLRLVSGGKEGRVDRRIFVPSNDAAGEPLPSWRVARWHLFNAATLLRAAYEKERRRDKARADDFEHAAAIAMQVFAALDPGFRAVRVDGRTEVPIEIDRASLREMARLCSMRPAVTKKHAEGFLEKKLPSTVEEARERFPGDEGPTNLASAALLILASQRHDDSVKVLDRWSVASAEDALRSSQFTDDLAELTSVVHELLADAGVQSERFGRALVRRMYRLLGLKHPFEGSDRQARRRRRQPAK
jgi:hypothetical protein